MGHIQEEKHLKVVGGGLSPVAPSTRPHRPTYVPMIRFLKHWCRKVTKVGYR